MTPKNTPEQTSNGAEEPKLAYVRAINVAELGDEIETPEGVEELYALHDDEGRRLALFGDRAMAFAVAHSNELNAVSVH